MSLVISLNITKALKIKNRPVSPAQLWKTCQSHYKQSKTKSNEKKSPKEFIIKKSQREFSHFDEDSIQHNILEKEEYPL